jgi:periplasmic glucans biosynthesis protein
VAVAEAAENLTEKQEVRLSDLLRYRLRSVRSYLLKDDVQHLSYCAVILFLGIFPVSSVSTQSEASDTKAPSKAFDFTEVERQAKALAGRPHIPVTQTLPEFLDRLDYDEYRDIHYRREKSLWLDEGLPFQLQFFHRGMVHKNRITVNIIDDGVSKPVRYAPELFDFGENELPQTLPSDLGFAGFRILYPLRKGGGPYERRGGGPYEEVAVFQGASYFRAVSSLGPWYGISDPIYGISARGLALDTGFAEPEEFPIFKEFWIEKPKLHSDTLTVYALLDSPSAAGAYRFLIHPGIDLSMEVKARVFLRQGVRRMGVAPLTSMFFHGDHGDRRFDDFRPEVHDSDGLLIATHSGEWLWRPLNNPRKVATSVFAGEDIAGFGLMQRDRIFDHYQDLTSMYHARPSAWVEPLGRWGPGSLYLIEIPSDAEFHDNIVVFFVPEKSTAAGQEWSFDYRLDFLLNSSPAPPGGKAVSTRTGASGTGRLDSSKRKFVVDFASEGLASLNAEAKLEPVLSASSGRIIEPELYKNLINRSWRLVFEFAPDPRQDPVELRAQLKLGNQVLTETWLYQWSGP